MGFDTLSSCRNKAKQLYSQWNIKPCRGRQRKTLGRVVDGLQYIEG